LPQVIVLDPGHGGPETGTCAGGLVEKNYQLAIGLRLRDALLERYEGITVLMTRETDAPVNPAATSLGEELQARCDLADAHPGSLLLSLHHDASGDGPGPSGGTVYVYGPQSWVPAVAADGTVHHDDPESYALAGRFLPVFRETLAKHGIDCNGIKAGNFRVLRETKGLAVLMEAFFATNPADVETAKTEAFQASLVDGYARMLGEALGLKAK
jgi:N-acetylmuramoyl-L-alanine amidase